MQPLKWKVMAWSLASLVAVTFVLRVVYGVLVPRTPHMVCNHFPPPGDGRADRGSGLGRCRGGSGAGGAVLRRRG